MASVLSAFLITLPKSRSFASRKTTYARNIVYTTAIAEDSVAVKTPMPVPTRMITSVSIGRIPRRMTLLRCSFGMATPLGKLYFLPMKKHSAIIAQPSTMPGTAPAMNSEPMETPPPAARA